MDHFATVNGIRLHYLDRPGGEPLVLLPGLTANCRAFDGVAAHICPRLRLIVPDLRGRGLSDRPAAGYTMADHAADVVALLDHLGLGAVSLGGHSFGGLLGIYLAARFPERVRRLVVVDAALASAHPRTRDLIRPSLARLERSYASWDEFIGLVRQAPYFHGWQWDPLADDYYRADVEEAPEGGVRPRSRPEQIAAVIEGVIGEPWPAHLDRVRAPALLLHGPEPYGPPGAPAIVSEEQAAETVSLLTGCRYLRVPGNHMTMLYGPGAAAIGAAILDFVDGPAVV